MVIGIGIDLIEIDRIKNAINKRKRFLNKIFTDDEIELFKTRKMNVNSIAGNFAAKEAVSKALGSGIRFSWKDIEILRDTSGKPYVNLYNDAERLYYKLQGSNILVSISHNKNNCVANCIITSGVDD